MKLGIVTVFQILWPLCDSWLQRHHQVTETSGHLTGQNFLQQVGYHAPELSVASCIDLQGPEPTFLQHFISARVLTSEV